jgi:hypothetical protein
VLNARSRIPSPLKSVTLRRSFSEKPDFSQRTREMGHPAYSVVAPVGNGDGTFQPRNCYSAGTQFQFRYGIDDFNSDGNLIWSFLSTQIPETTRSLSRSEMVIKPFNPLKQLSPTPPVASLEAPRYVRPTIAIEQNKGPLQIGNCPDYLLFRIAEIFGRIFEPYDF